MTQTHTCQDGTVVVSKEPIGFGLFQVQETLFMEGPYGGMELWWETVKMFQTLLEAEQWQAANKPADWTVRRVFVDPKEVNHAVA